MPTPRPEHGSGHDAPAAARRPPAAGAQPLASSQRPALPASAHRPPASGHADRPTRTAPTRTAQRAALTAHRPPPTAHRSPADLPRVRITPDRRPPDRDRRSPADPPRARSTADRPPPTADRPPTANRQPTTANRRPRTAFRKPPTAHDPDHRALRSTRHSPADSARPPDNRPVSHGTRVNGQRSTAPDRHRHRPHLERGSSNVSRIRNSSSTVVRGLMIAKRRCGRPSVEVGATNPTCSASSVALHAA